MIFRQTHSHTVDSWDEFVRILEEQPKFIYAHWDGTDETENKIKELTKTTISLYSSGCKRRNCKCILTGKNLKEGCCLESILIS